MVAVPVATSNNGRTMETVIAAAAAAGYTSPSRPSAELRGNGRQKVYACASCRSAVQPRNEGRDGHRNSRDTKPKLQLMIQQRADQEHSFELLPFARGGSLWLKAMELAYPASTGQGSSRPGPPANLRASRRSLPQKIRKVRPQWLEAYCQL